MNFVVYIVLTLLSFTMAINQEQRSLMIALKNSLQVLCPGVEICGNSTNPSRNVVYDGTSTSCCKACSCAEDCKKGTCCFNDTTESHEEDDKHACLYSIAFKKNVGQKRAYYMIDSPPQEGCVDDTHSCNTTYPWGDILPVISTSTNLIYKTPDCAKCHGISGYEEWDGELICAKIPDPSLFYQYFEDMQRYQVLSPECAMKFTYMGTTAYAGNGRCYFELTSECKDSFDVPPDVKMTRAEIIHACQKGPRMPFAYGSSDVSFYNVYCYICFGGSSQTLLCKVESGSIRNDPQTFTAVLDYKAVKRLAGSDVSTDKKITYVPVDACMDDEYASSFEMPPDSRCRDVLCPTGQTRDVDGTCTYFTAQWFGVNYVILIDIGIEKNFEHLALQINDIVEPLVQSLHMPSTWTNNAIFHAYPCEGPDSIFLNITVSYIVSSAMPYDTLLLFLEAFLKRPMILEYDGFKIPFSLSFSKYSKFKPSSSNRNILNPVYPFPDEFNVTKMCYNILKFDGDILAFREFLVTPMHLCEQITLMPCEYRLWQVLEARAIQYRGHLYYGSEFQLAFDGNGDHIVRICLEGSGFKKTLRLNSQSSGYGRRHTTYVFTVVGFLFQFTYPEA